MTVDSDSDDVARIYGSADCPSSLLIMLVTHFMAFSRHDIQRDGLIPRLTPA
jgi:hypothetical protein